MNISIATIEKPDLDIQLINQFIILIADKVQENKRQQENYPLLIKLATIRNK